MANLQLGIKLRDFLYSRVPYKGPGIFLLAVKCGFGEPKGNQRLIFSNSRRFQNFSELRDAHFVKKVAKLFLDS